MKRFNFNKAKVALFNKRPRYFPGDRKIAAKRIQKAFRAFRFR